LNRHKNPLLLLAAFLVPFCLLYLTRRQTVVYGYDPLGYLYAGQRLAAGKSLAFSDPNNALAGSYFAPFAFNIVHPGDPNLYFNYPPGLPLLLALAQRVSHSADAPFFFTPLAGLGGILALFWLGKQLFGPATGLLAAALLGLSPLYFTFSTDLWSDVPATALALIAMALYASSISPGSRHAVLKAASAAFLLGYAVLIRYSSAIIAAPIMLYGLTVAATPKNLSEKELRPVSDRAGHAQATGSNVIRIGSDARRRADLSFVAAFGLAIVGVLFFNRAYYGGFLDTAYSPRAGWYPWPAFSLAYALGPSPVGGWSLAGAWKTLLQDLPIALPLSLIGLAIMKRPAAALLGGTVLVVVGLYACYAFAPTDINARFLLPAVPMICLAAAFGLEKLRARLGKWQRSGVLLPIAAIALSIWLFRPAVAAVEQRALGTKAQIQYVLRMTEATPHNAVFMSYAYNDLISYYGRRSVLNYRRIPPADVKTGRYELEVLEPCLVEVVGKLLAAQTPVYYVEDKTPPFWDSLAILQRHFQLRLTQQDPHVYEVVEAIGVINQDEPSHCKR